jgi:hypothetical protein
MSDSTNESYKSLDDQEAELKAAQDAAGKSLMQAIVAYVDAVKQHHGLQQWRAGFNRGWDSSRDHFKQELKKSFEKDFDIDLTPTISHSEGVAPGSLTQSGWEPMGVANFSPPPQTPTAADLVAQFVYENSGRRGVEIADNFAKTVWRLPERTVRTALHRLKLAGKIRNVDGRWYSTESAPAGHELKLEE